MSYFAENTVIKCKTKNTTLSEQFQNPIEKQKNTTLQNNSKYPIEKQKNTKLSEQS